jgi:hypothetical protein
MTTGRTREVVPSDATANCPDVRAGDPPHPGNALDPSGFAISTAPGDQRRPAVVANGPFLVAWRDQRRGVGQHDVCGARVRADGRVIDRTGFAVAATDALEGSPAVAAGPGDRFAVVSQRFVPGAPYGSQRAFLRTVAPR